MVDETVDSILRVGMKLPSYFILFAYYRNAVSIKNHDPSTPFKGQSGV